MNNNTYTPTLSQQMPTKPPIIIPPIFKWPDIRDARVALVPYKTSYEYFMDKANDFWWENPEILMEAVVKAGTIIVPCIAYWTGKKLFNPDQEKNPVAYNLLETFKNISDVACYGVITVASFLNAEFVKKEVKKLLLDEFTYSKRLGVLLAPSVALTITGTILAGSYLVDSSFKTSYYAVKTTAHTAKAVVEGVARLANTTKNTFVGFMYSPNKNKTNQSTTVTPKSSLPKAVLAMG